MRNARLHGTMIVLMVTSIGIGGVFQTVARRRTLEQDAVVLARIHIVNSVEPLCREALPQEDKLLFLATPVSSAKDKGGALRLWMVECLDAQGEARLRIHWNAADKRLISLTCLNLRQPVLSRPSVSRKQAVDEARLWVERLGIAPRPLAQQCVASTETENNAYDIHLNLLGQSATVCINACSNDLRFVYVTRPSP